MKGAVSALGVWMAVTSPVLAQPAAAPGIEFGAGVLVSAPRSLGTSSADLTAPDGSAFEIFRVRHRQGVGIGIEAAIGARVAGPLWAEVSGSWGRPRLETRVFADLEGADDVVLTAPVSLVDVIGAAVWQVATGPRAVVFLRGGAGWAREFASSSGLVRDGVTGTAGVGVKYWRPRSDGQPGRVGVRAEIRASLRSGGLAPGPTGTSITPVLHIGILTRF